MLLHVKQHVRPEELWILVIVHGSAITPLREKGSHKTLANSLTMNTLLQQLQGGRGNSKQDTGKYFMRQRKAHMN